MTTTFLEIAKTNGAEINNFHSEEWKNFFSFSTWKETVEFQKNNGGEISLFYKKDGQSWQYKQKAYNPIEISSKDYGDDYSICYNKEALINEIKYQFDAIKYDGYEGDYETYLSERLVEFDSVDWNTEICVLHSGEFFESIQKECIDFYFDTEHWKIGIIENE